jgi:hypothetical protein
MKYILIFALLTSTFQLLKAQPLETVIKSQAIQMGKAMVVGDTKTFSKFMLPELMAAGGGGGKERCSRWTAPSIYSNNSVARCHESLMVNQPK